MNEEIKKNKKSNNEKQKERNLAIEKDEKETEKILNKYGVKKKQVMIALLLSLFVDMLGYSMILPLLPNIATEMGASDFLIGIVISANSFASLIFAPLWGHLSDRYGRKKLLMVNQLGTMFAFLMLASANSFEMILVARVIDGMFGGQFPIIKSVGSDITTHRTRMKTMTKIMMGVMLGMVIGPAIGGLLGAISWRYPAYLTALLAIISFLLTLKFLVETMPAERIADIKSAMRKKEVKSNLWKRNFEVRLFQIFLINLAFVAITTSLPLVLAKQFGSGPMEIGALMSFNGLILLLTLGIAVRKLGDKYSRKNQFIFAVLMMLIAYFMFAFLSAYWMYFVFLSILTIGLAFLRPLTQTLLLKSAPPDRQGAASGWGTNIQSVAESTAPLLAMWYLDIGGVALGSIFLSSYALIGVTTFIIALILGIIILGDIKANPDDF